MRFGLVHKSRITCDACINAEKYHRFTQKIFGVSSREFIEC